MLTWENAAAATVDLLDAVTRERDELREYGLQAASELGTLHAENERLRAALVSLISAGANGSMEFDAEARRIEREVLGQSE